MAPGAELCPTQENKREGIAEAQNFRILDYWTQVPTEAETCQPPLSHPRGWGWRCLVILSLPFPPPQMKALPQLFLSFK